MLMVFKKHHLLQQTYPSQNADLSLNTSTATHYIGQEYTSGSNFFDGYMSEVSFIDGSATRRNIIWRI
jgi:hypothetical protein